MNKSILKQIDLAFRPFSNKTVPIAEEIVKLIEDKKISYAEAYEALDIAKKGIETLILGA